MEAASFRTVVVLDFWATRTVLEPALKFVERHLYHLNYLATPGNWLWRNRHRQRAVA